MKLLKGKNIADKILSKIKAKIKKEKIKPVLAVVLIGENKASRIYVNLKKKAAKKIRVEFYLFKYGKNVSENEIIKKIKELNSDKKINGIIVQLPLPKKLNTQKIINAIDPKKDADGFSAKSLSVPVFPKAIMKMIESVETPRRGISTRRKNAIVIVNSEKFGEIMRKELKKKKITAEYILAKEIKIPRKLLIRNFPLLKGGEKNLPFQKGVPSQRGEGFLKKIKQADIIISAVGKPDLIKGAMIKKGAIIIDGGITKRGGKVLGDVDYESVKNIAGYLSPVPGGVGPVTVACLLENVYLLAKKQAR